MSDVTTRRPRAERREQIAVMALQIIGERGLTEFTTTVLAKAIGVTSGALFRHYVSRDEVLEEAVRLAELKIDATFPDESLAPRERLETLALARVALLSKEPGIAWLLRSAQAPLALPPPAVKRLRELVARSRAFIRRAMREAIEAGEIRDDISIDVILQVFTASVHALVTPPGVHAKRPATNTSKRTIKGLMTMLATPASSDKGK